MFVPNFKILGQAVPEKSLTQKMLTDRQPYWKGKNYIPPIYFVYRGYNDVYKTLCPQQMIVHKGGQINNVQLITGVRIA